MPGTRLNDTERKLKSWWQALSPTQVPFLKRVIIQSDVPIRGIKKCVFNINYPITVLCGKNGSGKSTLLQLTTLAFHNDDKHKRKTFKDFFYKTKYDADNNGISLKWVYSTDKEVPVLKGSKKWMHYERRPKKDVCVISPIDILFIRGALCQRDIDKANKKDFLQLSDTYLKYLNEILEKNYQSAEEMQDRFLSICSTVGGAYSCLNMGVGERALIHILKVFQDAQPNSLIAIDEIEMGIHPFALTKLANVIQRIAYEKKLQVLITTHSRALLDAFPREARVLVERIENEVKIINSPSTVYAISRISNKPNAEITVYCEDKFAVMLISWSAKELRTRISIIPAGGASELSRIAAVHLLSQHPSKPFVYWDGDVEDADINEYIEDMEGVAYAKFSSTQSPEEDILEVLGTRSDLVAILAESLGNSVDEVNRIIQRVRSESDSHKILYIFAEETGIDEEIIRKELVKILCQGKSQIANDIYQKLASMLK